MLYAPAAAPIYKSPRLIPASETSFPFKHFGLEREGWFQSRPLFMEPLRLLRRVHGCRLGCLDASLTTTAHTTPPHCLELGLQACQMLHERLVALQESIETLLRLQRMAGFESQNFDPQVTFLADA